MANALGNAAEAANGDATVLADIDRIVSQDTVVRPDLAIVCGDASERHVENTPALVVEILSKSTRERDRTHKTHLFQINAGPWCLITDPENRTTIAWQLDKDGEYTEAPLVINICDLHVDRSNFFS